MAAYGNQVLTEGKSEEEGLQYISDLLDNVPVQDESARDSLGTFLGGKGDVLLAYENEAIAAQHAGEDIDYVVPDSDDQDRDADRGDRLRRTMRRREFVDYEYTDEAQQLWADNGYRPVVESVFKQNADKFPTPADLFTIDDLGGWDQVTTDFFDPENGSIAEIDSNLGVATE